MAIWLTLLALLPVALGVDWNTRTRLDEYVARPDPNYKWEIFMTVPTPGITYYMINMTSQQWKDSSVTDLYIWQHWLTLAVPDGDLRFTDAAFMFIDGGNNPSSPPLPDDNFLEAVGVFANETKAVGAYLQQIPNQPHQFTEDPIWRTRTEDDAIAYTWRKFIQEHPDDPEWALQFPMIKACVRALDTMNAAVAQIKPGSNLTRFMAAGGSKRGWATALLACVDRRVMAFAPIVYSLINCVTTLRHHNMAYGGGWSFAFQDYYNENLTLHLDNPNTQLLFNEVDPYNYRERLTMPMLTTLATNDEFFRPDEPQFWMHQFPGEKHLNIIPNAQHSMFPWYEDVYINLRAFFLTIVQGGTLPSLSWTRTEDATSGTVTLTTDREPIEVRSWDATTDYPPRRDWRWAVYDEPYIQDVFWEEAPVEDLGGNQYRATFDKVPTRWKGFYIEAIFEGPEGTNYTLSTELHVVPDTYPVPPCSGTNCQGYLV